MTGRGERGTMPRHMGGLHGPAEKLGAAASDAIDVDAIQSEDEDAKHAYLEPLDFEAEAIMVEAVEVQQHAEEDSDHADNAIPQELDALLKDVTGCEKWIECERPSCKQLVIYDPHSTLQNCSNCGWVHASTYSRQFCDSSDRNN